eukprot:jgi/Psemu1/66314/estExt_Genemark1.C_1940036
MIRAFHLSDITFYLHKLPKKNKDKGEVIAHAHNTVGAHFAVLLPPMLACQVFHFWDWCTVPAPVQQADTASYRYDNILAPNAISAHSMRAGGTTLAHLQQGECDSNNNSLPEEWVQAPPAEDNDNGIDDDIDDDDKDNENYNEKDNSQVESEHDIPTFSFSDLRTIANSNTNAGRYNRHDNNNNNNNNRLEEFRRILSSTGLLAVRLDDDDQDGTATTADHAANNQEYEHQQQHQHQHQYQYALDRRVAMDGLCSCIDHPEFLDLEQTHQLTLADSTTNTNTNTNTNTLRRTSIATATVGLDHPLSLPKGLEDTCGHHVVEAMEGLRDVVSSVSRVFVSALDSALVVVSDAHDAHDAYDAYAPPPPPPPLLRDRNGKSYKSMSEIIRSANHLEHFHVYTNTNGEQKKKKKKTQNPPPSSSSSSSSSSLSETDADTETETETVAWDWHTDAGLFLVFVPAWDCNNENENVDESFYYRDSSDGTPIRARFDGDRTAIVMLGQGAQDWLDLPVLSKSMSRSQSRSQSRSLQHQKPNKHKQQPLLLKATSHSVRWSNEPKSSNEASSVLPPPSSPQPPLQLQQQQQRRAWYGMMHLVPETAMIYGGKTLKEVKESLSLSQKIETNYDPSLPSSSPTPLSAGVSLGCGDAPPSRLPSHQRDADDDAVVDAAAAAFRSKRRRHLQMQDPSMCNNVTNFFCWMTCMDIPKVDQADIYVDAGYSLYCVDEAIMAASSDNNNNNNNNNIAKAHEACEKIHNPACKGAWEKTVDGVPSAEINTTAIDDRNNEIEIDYPFCYGGTTMYMDGFQWIQSSTCVILLVPSWVLNTASKYAAAVIGTVLLAIGLEKFIQQRRKTMAYMESGTKRLIVSGAFYGVQLTIGYLLMLVIMIYSGVLFLAVILGLVVGHVMFNAKDAIWPIHNDELSNLHDDDGVVGTDVEGENSDIGVNMGAMDTKSSGSDNGSDGDNICCNGNRNGNGNGNSNGSHHHSNDYETFLRNEPGEERAIREGSTFCQEFGVRSNEYYGSMECHCERQRFFITEYRKEARRVVSMD